MLQTLKISRLWRVLMTGWGFRHGRLKKKLRLKARAKKKSVWGLRNTDFCGSETGPEISYLFWGRLNKIVKGEVKKKAGKWSRFGAQKTGSNAVFFSNVFLEKMTLWWAHFERTPCPSCAPDWHTRVRGINKAFDADDQNAYAFIRLLKLMIRIPMNL